MRRSDALTTFWIAAALTTALAALAGCAWVIGSHSREPRPLDGYGFAAFFLLGLAALLALAAGLARAGGPWAAAGIVAVNVLIQPLCLHLFLSGAYQFARALAGSLVYAGRVVPVTEMPPQTYRRLRWHFLMQGVVACLLGACLTCLCLGLLL